MRFFLFLFVGVCFLLPNTAFTDGAPLPEGLRSSPQEEYKTRTSLLRKEYKHCEERSLSALSPQDRELFCSCFVAQANTLLPSDRELRRYILKQDGWRRLKDMLMFQASPLCMSETLKHFSQEECLRTMRTKPGFIMVGSICQCTGEKIEKFVKTETGELIQWYLRDNPNGFTPFQKFMIPIEYGNRYELFMQSCIEHHEYGWK